MISAAVGALAAFQIVKPQSRNLWLTRSPDDIYAAFVSAGNMFVTFLLPALHRPASVPSADLLDGRFALSINRRGPPRLAVKRRKQAFYTSCLLRFMPQPLWNPFLFIRDEVSTTQHTGREADAFGFWEVEELKNVGVTLNVSVMRGIKEGDSRHSGLLRHLCATIWNYETVWNYEKDSVAMAKLPSKYGQSWDGRRISPRLRHLPWNRPLLCSFFCIII